MLLRYFEERRDYLEYLAHFILYVYVGDYGYIPASIKSTRTGSGSTCSPYAGPVSTKTRAIPVEAAVGRGR